MKFSFLSPPPTRRTLAMMGIGMAAALFTSSASALVVFACEPEWGALVQELAGDKAQLSVATTALQDVHHIEAKPSLIAKVRRADLIVCTGAELESGWLPQLLRQASNPRVSSGRGYFMAAEHVITLEKPTLLSRAEGDVHAQGNPHIQLDPHRVLAVATALNLRLMQLDAAHAPYYQQRFQSFSARWQTAITRWQATALPLKGKRVIVHHGSWVYLLKWLGIHQVGALEPKPGIPPSSAQLSQLIALTKTQPIYAIVRAAYQDDKPTRWLSARTQVPVVVLPYTVGADAASGTLFTLFDRTISQLLAAQQRPEAQP